MPVMNPSLQRSPMAVPYQPFLLLRLHGATAVLVSIGWITGLRGWPLVASMLRLRVLPNDGALHWPGQLLRYLRRGC
jgi:hypothetical protein